MISPFGNLEKFSKYSPSFGSRPLFWQVHWLTMSIVLYRLSIRSCVTLDKLNISHSSLVFSYFSRKEVHLYHPTPSIFARICLWISMTWSNLLAFPKIACSVFESQWLETISMHFPEIAYSKLYLLIQAPSLISFVIMVKYLSKCFSPYLTIFSKKVTLFISNFGDTPCCIGTKVSTHFY